MSDLNFSPVRLFVLGLLEIQPRHGYEIVAIAERWAVHRWAGISIGATYHSLGRLQKDGFVTAGKVEKAGNRPERQVWEITESGRATVRRYVEIALSSLNFEGRDVDMGLAFAGLLDPETRKKCLVQRMKPLNERLDQLRSFHEGYESCDVNLDPGLDEYRRLKREQPWIAASVEHGLGRLEWEATWTNKLIGEVANWPSITKRTEVRS